MATGLLERRAAGVAGGRLGMSETEDAGSTVPPGSGVIGEVITWDIQGCTETVARLKSALELAGLDTDLIRPMAHSDGFRRAVKSLARDRIIRLVDESPDVVRFQFTAETKATDHLEYAMEAVVSLHKESGDIECPDLSIAARARQALDHELATRNGADISRLVRRLFEDKHRADLDLIPLRDAGSVYFVRAEGRALLDKIAVFLDSIGCRLNRFPVARSGDNQSVRDAVRDKMAGLIAEYNAAVDAFGADTRESTMLKAAERVRLLAFKVKSYATYLDDERVNLEDAVTEAESRLRATVARVHAEKAKAAAQPES